MTSATTPPKRPDKLPVWVRLPKPGDACPITSLRRTVLNELVLPSAQNNFAPPVKSVVRKRPGRNRGVRLIHLPSLLAYLDKLADEQRNQNPNPPNE